MRFKVIIEIDGKDKVLIPVVVGDSHYCKVVLHAPTLERAVEMAGEYIRMAEPFVIDREDIRLQNICSVIHGHALDYIAAITKDPEQVLQEDILVWEKPILYSITFEEYKSEK